VTVSRDTFIESKIEILKEKYKGMIKKGLTKNQNKIKKKLELKQLIDQDEHPDLQKQL